MPDMVHVTVRIPTTLRDRLQAVLAKANAATTPGVRELSMSDVMRGMLFDGVKRAEQGNEAAR